MRRGGKITFFIGLVLGVLSLLLTAVTSFGLVDRFSGAGDTRSLSNGSVSVDLDEGDARGIYEQSSSGSASASCTVTGPSGGVPLTGEGELDVELNGQSYVGIGNFEAEESGSYAVECTGGSATTLGPAFDLGGFAGGVVGLIGGVVGLIVAAILILIGGIVWLIGRSTSSTTRFRGPGTAQDRGTATFGAGAYQGQDPSSAYGPGTGYTTPPPPRQGRDDVDSLETPEPGDDGDAQQGPRTSPPPPPPPPPPRS